MLVSWKFLQKLIYSYFRYYLNSKFCVMLMRVDLNTNTETAQI